MPSGPTYPLAEVMRLIAAGAYRVTSTAEQTARSELGLTLEGVLRCVRKLKPTDFYKTMPAEQVQGLFQDVYHPVFVTPMHQGGIKVYCKIQVNQERTVVISFKAR